MEAANSPADLVTTYQLTWRHIPEDLNPPAIVITEPHVTEVGDEKPRKQSPKMVREY